MNLRCDAVKIFHCDSVVYAFESMSLSLCVCVTHTVCQFTFFCFVHFQFDFFPILFFLPFLKGVCTFLNTRGRTNMFDYINAHMRDIFSVVVSNLGSKCMHTIAIFRIIFIENTFAYTQCCTHTGHICLIACEYELWICTTCIAEVMSSSAAFFSISHSSLEPRNPKHSMQ